MLFIKNLKMQEIKSAKRLNIIKLTHEIEDTQKRLFDLKRQLKEEDQLDFRKVGDVFVCCACGPGVKVAPSHFTPERTIECSGCSFSRDFSIYGETMENYLNRE